MQGCDTAMVGDMSRELEFLIDALDQVGCKGEVKYQSGLGVQSSHGQTHLTRNPCHMAILVVSLSTFGELSCDNAALLD